MGYVYVSLIAQVGEHSAVSTIFEWMTFRFIQSAEYLLTNVFGEKTRGNILHSKFSANWSIAKHGPSEICTFEWDNVPGAFTTLTISIIASISSFI